MNGPASEAFPVPADGTGVVLWDKPAGVTSHDVVEEARRQTGLKAGHAGTLDPFATGLLVILLGRATRLQRYFLELPKRYRATARLGWHSSTGDPDGELVETGVIPDELVIPEGSRRQMVPMTSAAKVDGERLYRKAHRGERVADRPVRTVEVISSKRVEGERDGDRAVFELEVSSGTYVRNLVEEMGDAYCEELRRTGIGPFEVGEAPKLLEPAEGLSFLPRVELDAEAARSAANGRAVPLEPGHEDGQALCLVSAGRAVAVARWREGVARPEVVIRPASG